MKAKLFGRVSLHRKYIDFLVAIFKKTFQNNET